MYKNEQIQKFVSNDLIRISFKIHSTVRGLLYFHPEQPHSYSVGYLVV